MTLHVTLETLPQHHTVETLQLSSDVLAGRQSAEEKSLFGERTSFMQNVGNNYTEGGKWGIKAKFLKAHSNPNVRIFARMTSLPWQVV